MWPSPPSPASRVLRTEGTGVSRLVANAAFPGFLGCGARVCGGGPGSFASGLWALGSASASWPGLGSKTPCGKSQGNAEFRRNTWKWPEIQVPALGGGRPSSLCMVTSAHRRASLPSSPHTACPHLPWRTLPKGPCPLGGLGPHRCPDKGDTVVTSHMSSLQKRHPPNWPEAT